MTEGPPEPINTVKYANILYHRLFIDILLNEIDLFQEDEKEIPELYSGVLNTHKGEYILRIKKTEKQNLRTEANIKIFFEEISFKEDVYVYEFVICYCGEPICLRNPRQLMEANNLYELDYTIHFGHN